MVIYFISGLGADRRAFERISVPAGYEMRHIDWEPVDGTESLPAYAARLAEKIDASAPFMLAGLSFGGLVAAEIAKLSRPAKLILFSTVSTRRQLSPVYRLSGKLHLEKLISRAILSLNISVFYWYFGPLDHRGRQLIASFVKQLDPVFLRWALGHISRWQNNDAFPGYLHIHGSADKVFGVHRTGAQYIIKGGGHFCVLTHADQVNEILMREL